MDLLRCIKVTVFDRIVILPPRPGACPICAARHKENQPHNPESLYYQVRFRQKHRRFPTWADAMAHCSEGIQKIWIDGLAERGVIVEIPPHNGASDG